MAEHATRRAKAAATCLTCAVLLGCGDDYQPLEPGDLCGEQMAWAESDFADSLLRCDVAPELCGLPVESIVVEPDLQTAIDVVFVSDGYADLAPYRTHVASRIESMLADDRGIVGRALSLFNFHRVDLVSESSDPSARPLRSCVERTTRSDSLLLSGDVARAVRAAANAPDVDVVIVVALSTPGRARTTDGPFGTKVVHSHHDYTHHSHTHELGHALVGLADEYSDIDEPHPFSDQYDHFSGNPLARNLSLSPDGDWDGLVTGSVEGGDGYAYDVFHPTDHCRMIDPFESDFCPVCEDAIDEMLAARRGAQDGAPRCALALPEQRGPYGTLDFLYRATDANGVRSVDVFLNGEHLLQELPTRDLPLAPPTAWFTSSLSVEAAETVEIVCTDALGESSEAKLDVVH